MSIKAIGIAIKLSLEGTNQAKYFQTWIFAMVAITCIITQLNYLNMVSIVICSSITLSYYLNGYAFFILVLQASDKVIFNHFLCDEHAYANEEQITLQLWNELLSYLRFDAPIYICLSWDQVTIIIASNPLIVNIRWT